MTVSYTHLDVYKRQILDSDNQLGNMVLLEEFDNMRHHLPVNDRHHRLRPTYGEGPQT